MPEKNLGPENFKKDPGEVYLAEKKLEEERAARRANEEAAGWSPDVTKKAKGVIIKDAEMVQRGSPESEGMRKSVLTKIGEGAKFENKKKKREFDEDKERRQSDSLS